MTLQFTIVGNQESKIGNPIPYHRATQGSRWNPAHRRYLLWKDHVKSAFKKVQPKSPFCPLDNLDPHPIVGNVHGRVRAYIYFGDETHADPDNIVKGILDSLFKNDKHIDVETAHSCKDKKPRVEVRLTIESKP